jgi:hypothetical protein
MGQMYFTQCTGEHSVIHYYLSPDSLIIVQSRAEQWKTPSKHIGNWRQSGNESIKMEIGNSSPKAYRVIEIRSLKYLIGPNMQADSVAHNIGACLDKEIDLIKLTDERGDIEFSRKIEYPIAKKCNCKLDVLVEIPERWVKVYGLKLHYRSKKRN